MFSKTEEADLLASLNVLQAEALAKIELKKSLATRLVRQAEAAMKYHEQWAVLKRERKEKALGHPAD